MKETIRKGLILMAVAEVKSPVYDDRVKEIIRSLTEGKSREDIAKVLGHSTWHSSDMYMRRKGFIWDQSIQNYVPNVTTVKLKNAISQRTTQDSLGDGSL